MPQSRSSSPGSEASAESAGKSSRSSGSVLSKVLGSIRRVSSNSDATANSKEGMSWADTYKITHHPDRPLQDERAGLRHRDSVYVLGQLRKIWKHNEKITETKRRERRARERAGAAGLQRSGSRSQSQRRRADEHMRGVSRQKSVGRGSRPRVPKMQTDLAPNSSRKVSPELARDRRGVDGEAQHHQPSLYPIATNEAGKSEKHRHRAPTSPLPMSAASDKMTIRVGLEMQSPRETAESEGSRRQSGRAEERGYSQTRDVVPTSSGPQLPAFRFLTPLPAPTQSASPFLPPAQKDTARRRQYRTLSPPPRQATPYVGISQDSPPSLTAISSPTTSQGSPPTPAAGGSGVQNISDKLASAERGVAATTTCPMPLCTNTLTSFADRKQNLCGECRRELQPRDSIFATELLSPALAAPHDASLADIQHISNRQLKRPPQRALYLDSPSEARPGTVDSSCSDDSPSVIELRVTEIVPSSPDTETETTRNNSGSGSSSGDAAKRSNKRRTEFKLQPVPVSRKHGRRARMPQLGKTTHTDHAAAKPKPKHKASTPASPRRPGMPPRRPSGPLLEPKTFRPPTPITRQQGKESPGGRRGAGTRSTAQSSFRARVERSGLRPDGASPSQRTNNKPGASATGKLTDNSAGAREIKKKKADPGMGENAADEAEIYREIESIIDCYLWRPGAAKSENEKRKAETVAEYFAEVPLDVEMKIKGFI